jgi:predicted transcriptional regulator
MQETQTQKEERKNMYISYVLAHAKGMSDREVLIKEAVMEWEKHNTIKISQELNIWKMR